MRLAVLALSGCFVITPGDVQDHDALTGEWEGEWEAEDGPAEGGLEIVFGKADWSGSMELEGSWSESELEGQRQGDELTMLLYGDEPHEFEASFEADLKSTDRIEGDCTISVWGGEHAPCSFSLRPL